MELGQTRDLSEPFIARRSLIHRSVAKDVERVMNKLNMVSLAISSAPVQTSGYFWKKTEQPDLGNLLDDDSYNPDDVLNCPICRDEFKTFSKKKKEKCLICSRIVCSSCHAHVLPIKGAVDGVERELKLCTTCHNTITKEQKRLQLKNYFANSAKSGFTTFYEEMFFLVSVIQRDLPKLRYLLETPLTASSLKKAKELDVSLGKTLSDFEREIKNLEHFQVTTKKQQQLRDAIKMGFITSLSGTGPEYKLLHRQLETAATQPLAPDDPSAVTSTAITKALTTHHSRSHSATHAPVAAQAVAAPTMTPVLNSKKDKRRTLLGNRLSSFTSLFSSDSKNTSNITLNSDNGPYISGINPVLSRMSGGERITILGERFDSKCGVQIGGVDCPVMERNEGMLVVLSPSQSIPEPQDVCVYNPNGERCVMEQMLFYADDKMFAQETPTVPETQVYNLSSQNPNSPNTVSYHKVYSEPKPTSFSKNNNHDFNKHDISTSYNSNSNNYNHEIPNSESGRSGILGTSASSGSSRSFGSFNTNNQNSSSSLFSTSSSSMNGSNSYGKSNNLNQIPRNNNNNNNNFNHSNNNEFDEDAEISLVIIKPLMSPLKGTRVTMELNHPLPPSTSIKVGGKTIQFHPSEDNPRELSFISPPLSSGSKSIEIILPGSGRVVVLDSILQYDDNFTPETNYTSVTQKATPPTSGRVWGKRG